MKNAFLIGEIAELYNIGADSVRYYEEQGLITPQRGKNGYRTYSLSDIWRMNVIRDLRSIGFSLERIKQYLDKRSIESTLELLHEEEKAIMQKKSELEALQKNVARRMKNIENAQQRPLGMIEESSIAPRRCHFIEEAFASDEEADVLMKRLLNLSPERLYLIGSNNIGCRLGLEQAKNGSFNKYNAAFIIDSEGNEEIAGGRYLRLSYSGASKLTARYAPQMLEYAKNCGLKPTGDILELILIDVHEAENPAEHITELQMLVT